MTGIWYALNDEHRFVYHYTNPIAIESILRSGRLRFSRFEGVNDPREAKDWTFGYSTWSGLPLENMAAISAEATLRLKRNIRIGCFVSDVYESLVTRPREDAGEDIIRAPYERGHARPAMWHFYGEKHTGACLVFFRDALNSAILSTVPSSIRSLIRSAQVRYDNPHTLPKLDGNDALILNVDHVGQIGLGNALMAHFSRFADELFFVKAKEWEREREYRWLIPWDAAAEFEVAFVDSLTGILVGDKASASLKRVVGEYAHLNRNVHVAEMRWQNGFPQPIPTHWRLLLNA